MRPQKYIPFAATSDPWPFFKKTGCFPALFLVVKFCLVSAVSFDRCPACPNLTSPSLSFSLVPCPYCRPERARLDRQHAGVEEHASSKRCTTDMLGGLQQITNLPPTSLVGRLLHDRDRTLTGVSSISGMSFLRVMTST